MTAQELRIENLVLDILTGKVCSVDAISLEGDIYTYDKTYDEHQRKISPEPIPLSEEWLLKFGFENRYLRLKYPNSELRIWISESGTTFTLGPVADDYLEFVLETKVEYVHQLQNLFWCLCGEELTIKEQ